MFMCLCNTYGQGNINVLDAGPTCIADVFDNTATLDGGSPQRYVFEDLLPNANVYAQIKWNNSTLRWELRFDFRFGTSSDGDYEELVYSSTYASAPNPPNLTVGNWINETGGACGNLTQFDGAGTHGILSPVEVLSFDVKMRG